MANDPYSGFPQVIATQLLEVFRHSGWLLSVQWQPAVCKVRFADGRMMLVNYDVDRNRVWLAGGESGTEYVFRNERWISVQSGSELYADTAALLEALVQANPLNAQQGQVSEADGQVRIHAVHAPDTGRLRWPYLMLLAVAVLIGYHYLMPRSESAAAPLSPTEMVPLPVTAEQQCEPNAPASGTSKQFEGLRAGSGQTAVFSISNNHNHDMLVSFTRPGSAIPLQSVYLRSRSDANVPVTAGDYELMFSVGTVWCSLEAGFKDGVVTKLGRRFSLQPRQAVALELQSTGAQATAFAVFVRDETKTPNASVGPPAVQIIGNSEMRLQRAQDGHYYLQGSVNGRPVDFLVDTGASFTTLKQDIAIAGGIQDCQATQSKTANGIVDVCIGIIPEIRVGAYLVRNAVVVANPKTEANLLGMNVLGQFRIATENGVMTLTRP